MGTLDMPHTRCNNGFMTGARRLDKSFPTYRLLVPRLQLALRGGGTLANK